MMPSPAFAPSQALANISALMRSRIRHAGADAAMSRMVSTCTEPPGARTSWPDLGS